MLLKWNTLIFQSFYLNGQCVRYYLPHYIIWKSWKQVFPFNRLTEYLLEPLWLLSLERSKGGTMLPSPLYLPKTSGVSIITRQGLHKHLIIKWLKSVFLIQVFIPSWFPCLLCTTINLNLSYLQMNYRLKKLSFKLILIDEIEGQNGWLSSVQYTWQYEVLK